MASEQQDGKAETSTGTSFSSSFKHPALIRLTERIFLLQSPTCEATFDVGQIKEFVLFDQHLRQKGTVKRVPFGYSLFAETYNGGAEGTERFATYSIGGRAPNIQSDCEAIKWEIFEIDDSLVGWGHSGDSKDGTDGSFVFVNSERESSQKKLEEIATKLKARIKLLHTIDAFYNKRVLIDVSIAHGLTELVGALTDATDSVPELENVLLSLRLETRAQANFHSNDASRAYSGLIQETLTMIQTSEAFLNKALVPMLKNLSNDLVGQRSQQQTGIDTLLGSYHSLEATQLGFLKNTLWAYANLVSRVCVDVDKSSEKLRLALEKFLPPAIAEPYFWDSSLDWLGANPIPSSKPGAVTIPSNNNVEPANASLLPQTIPANNVEPKSVLFYVKALYDYKAAAPEDLEFKAGDVIAVTKTQEGGWWTGELFSGDQSIKAETKVFPSNFVSLF
ncbi:hypothetical protein CPB83DRAFT_862173 [Crepidotus variabilis]|uniref:SH3 domain-containing protein n=1 Tax=Crepidotus variabilis TaxID=179855 RepID=A0A9P6JK33_9AGAR|nr:hypothetical protein CPB83DRAFT_862173 [Crepidotus variabilis]